MRKRKILSFILILALVFALAPLTGSPISVSAAGTSGDWIANGNPTAPADISEDEFDGSEEGQAILITSASELAWLAQQVNGGTTFLDKHIRLTANLDLSSHDWVPIGTVSSFGGTFYGDGHTISGLTIDGTYQFAGLFGWITHYSMTHLSVENLHIGENSSIQNNMPDSGGTGGIAGFMNIGRISGCSNAGSIVASNSAIGGIGGIVGHADMYSIDNCWNTGNVTGDNAYVGGIVGYANGEIAAESSIDNCYNTGNISSDCSDFTYYLAVAGGIAGLLDIGRAIQNCYNAGDITSSSWSSALAGGIAGYPVGDILISYCYSSGSVTAEGDDAYAGGITGKNYEGAGLAPFVQNCAALNEKVVNRSTATSACRIGYQGVLRDNFALKTMVVTLDNVNKTITSDPSGEDGAELEADSLKGSWWIDEAWDTDVWTLPGEDAHGLAILKNVGGTQSAELPGYMPIAPTIKTSSMPGGTVGVAYSQQLTASGGTPITWSVTTGTMPAGLTLSGITISGTPSTAGNYSFTIRAENAIGSDTQDYSITISPAPPVSDGPGGGGGGGGNTNEPSKPVTTGNTTTVITAATATVDGSGRASAAVTKDQLNAAVNSAVAEAKKQGDGVVAVVEIKVEAPANSNSVETGIPRDALGLAVSGGTDALKISTPVASISFDTDALTKIYGEASADVKVSAGKVDSSSLAEDAKQIIGDRPVFNFSVTSGNNTIAQFGGNVSVAVPYTPKAGEDTDAIVIYYINSQGKPEAVGNCKYDPMTKTVSFTTDHFSQYAVGYNEISFGDVKDGVWYGNAVEFAAARGIVTGTGNGNFDPNGKLTRGQLLVMLMRAYDIEPDTDTSNNFSDAGNKYYTGYLAAAKRLDITEGLGNNIYAPDKQITRQEMFTLLYNTLKVIGQLPDGTGKTSEELTGYSDADSIDSWAKDAAGTLASAGVIGGSNGKLLPKSTTTRAEMAQVLYNLLSK